MEERKELKKLDDPSQHLFVIEIRVTKDHKTFAPFLAELLEKIDSTIKNVTESEGFSINNRVMIVSHEYLYGYDLNKEGMTVDELAQFELSLQSKTNEIEKKYSIDIAIAPGSVILKNGEVISNRAYFFTPNPKGKIRYREKEKGKKVDHLFDWNGKKVLLAICFEWSRYRYGFPAADIYFIPSSGMYFLTNGAWDPSVGSAHQVSNKPGVIFINSDKFLVKYSGVYQVRASAANITFCLCEEEEHRKYIEKMVPAIVSGCNILEVTFPRCEISQAEEKKISMGTEKKEDRIEDEILKEKEKEKLNEEKVKENRVNELCQFAFLNGSLFAFERMLKDEKYSDVLNHKSSEGLTLLEYLAIHGKWDMFASIGNDNNCEICATKYIIGVDQIKSLYKRYQHDPKKPQLASILKYNFSEKYNALLKNLDPSNEILDNPALLDLILNIAQGKLNAKTLELLANKPLFKETVLSYLKRLEVKKEFKTLDKILLSNKECSGLENFFKVPRGFLETTRTSGTLKHFLNLEKNWAQNVRDSKSSPSLFNRRIERQEPSSEGGLAQEQSIPKLNSSG